MRVFVDVDGPISAFSDHVLERFGQHPNQIPDDDLWELVAATPDFWSTIPLKYGSHDLWALVQPYNPVFLTGCPRNYFEVAAMQKTAWLKRNFGDDVEVICCLSRNKSSYMESPGDILIDDFKSNTRRWIKAGGRAVQYRTVQQAITDFKILVG